MLRFGLCCIFSHEPIKFKRTTATYLKKYPRGEQLQLISSIIVHNARSLLDSLKFCHDKGIGDFRINSQILPLKTHQDIEYKLDELPESENIYSLFKQCKDYAEVHNIRTTFHPDQFILLSSPTSMVTQNSIKDLMYHAEAAEMINADVINIHPGGVYGDKDETLKRLMQEIEKLPDNIRKRLTLENDDKSYSPDDLFPICKSINIPLVYDIHHHRCLHDNVNVGKTTEMALKTWDREPLFHISSPKHGWHHKKKSPHADFIDINDFPLSWLPLNITIEIEAKSKELAVLKLMKDINSLSGPTLLRN